MTAATLPEALRQAARVHATRTAVADSDRRLTFAELHLGVQSAARALVSLGVRPGDRVCLWAPNSWQWVVTALATTYIGAALVPLNSRYTGHEAVDVVRRTRARVVVLADGFLGRNQLDELRSAAAEDGTSNGQLLSDCPDTVAVVRIEHPGATSVDDPRVVGFDRLRDLASATTLDLVEELAGAVTPDDVADILFTSGTTGRSKGACSAHRQTLAVAEAWATQGEVTAADTYFVVNPFFHAFGYKAGLVVCLLRGVTIVTRPTFVVDELRTLMRTEQVSVLAAAPPVFQALLEGHDRPTTLRLAVTGATLVPVALVERVQRELGCAVVLTAYGLTEAVVATMCRAGDAPELVARTVGAPVAGFEVRVVDPVLGSDMQVGAEGEVWLRGANVMLGYLDDPAATAQAINPDGWLKTGDVGSLDAQGCLTITDRLKDVVIVGGFNVYPAEVEQVLARLEDVVEAAAVGVPDERLGEVTMAYVVRRPGASLDEAAIIEHCRQRLANFKVPRSVEFVEALPRNASGKVLRRTLRGAPIRG